MLVDRCVVQAFAKCFTSKGNELLPIHTQTNAASHGRADAIIVLAGGQDEDRPSGLPEWVDRRLEACAEILQAQPQACKILCSGGGT
jgi:hypothetical protein